MLKTKRKLWIWISAGIGSALATAGILALLITLLPKAETPEKERPQHQVPATTAPLIPENPLLSADFTYENGYLTCLTYPSVLGVDVSSHRGQIDWEQVKGAGVSFAILRLGYRGTDLGGIYEDEWFARNYEGAKDAGLQVGAYFFSQAVTEEEAREEAAFALTVLEGKPLDMPLVFDWEDTGPDSRVAGMDPDRLTRCTAAFCEAVEAAGLQPMVYFNPDQSRYLLHLEALTDYPFWLAMYTDEMTYAHRVDMWQYTCTGTVPGIDGDVDINLYFPDLRDP